MSPDLTVRKYHKTLSVKLEMDVVESARVVSAIRGHSMTELLSALLRPLLAELEQEDLAARLKLRKPESPKKRGAKK
jgi:hypothetical protein